MSSYWLRQQLYSHSATVAHAASNQQLAPQQTAAYTHREQALLQKSHLCRSHQVMKCNDYVFLFLINNDATVTTKKKSSVKECSNQHIPSSCSVNISQSAKPKLIKTSGCGCLNNYLVLFDPDASSTVKRLRNISVVNLTGVSFGVS